MRRKRLLCSRGYQPRSSWPTPPMTPITCAKPSPPKARSPSFPTTRRARSNIRSTSISMPSAISLNAASQSSSNSAALQPASKRQPEITLQSSPSQPSSYGCDKCPHHLEGVKGKTARVHLQTRMKGIYQHCSEKHLHRYLAEFDFRYSNRIALGIDDGERADLAAKGAAGKRL